MNGMMIGDRKFYQLASGGNREEKKECARGAFVAPATAVREI